MSSPLVRSAEIAAMANVSRAAVTQWRKRYKDNFPKPVEGSDPDSPLFERTAVERWLKKRSEAREQGISLESVKYNVSEETSTRAQTPSLTPDEIGRSLAHLLKETDLGGAEGIDLVGAALVAEYVVRGIRSGVPFAGAAAALHDAQLDVHQLKSRDFGDIRPWLQVKKGMPADLAATLSPLADPSTRAEGFLISLRAHIRTVETKDLLKVYDVLINSDRQDAVVDPVELSEFLADLAHRESGTVLDPAVGPGGTLLTVGQNCALDLIGVDVEERAVATAMRRGVLANRALDLRLGNSLGNDPAADVRADIVITTPPWGIRDFGAGFERNDPRWAFGRPSPRSEGIWLQHAISRLKEAGRAFVVTPISELTRIGPSEELRRDLLRRGSVEAIISLPTGLFLPRTRIATAVWILSRPGEQSANSGKVLLISTAQDKGASLSEAVDQYRAWNQGGRINHAHSSLEVSVLKLLEPGADLMPETWLARRDAPNAQQYVDEIHNTYKLVAETDLPPMPVIADFAPADTVRKERLSSLPGVTVHRGLVGALSGDVDPTTGVPVLSVPDLVEYTNTGKLEPTRSIDPATLKTTPTTRAGDIVVNDLHHVPAQKIDLEGWVLASPGYLIRVEPDAGIDPDYLVAVINAQARVQRDTIAGRPRILPSRLEIPIIPLPDQRRISQTLHDIQTRAAAIEQQQNHIQQLSRLLEDAAAAGALTTPHT